VPAFYLITLGRDIGDWPISTGDTIGIFDLELKQPVKEGISARTSGGCGEL